MRKKKGSAGFNILFLGCAVIFLLTIMSYAVIELKSSSLKSLVIDSVLKQSALSALKYDIREYGTTHKIRINPEEVDVNGETPYDSFIFSLKQGLYLDDTLKSINNKYVYDKVTIEHFIIYNVDKDNNTVEVISKNITGYTVDSGKPLGVYKDIKGDLIKETSILVEIKFNVEVGNKTHFDDDSDTKKIESSRCFVVGISEK